MNRYYKLMASEDRVIVIKKDGTIHTLVALSICNDYKPYSEKDLWDVLPHDPNGRICFIEQLISFEWSREIFRELEKTIVTKYPSIEEAVWFRPGKAKERKVIYRRKFHEASV